MEFEFELINNTINPDPYSGNSLTFKPRIDASKHHDILANKVLGVRVDLSAFRGKLNPGVYGQVEKRNSSCHNLLLDILLKKPKEIRHLSDTLFHINHLFIKAGTVIEEPLVIRFELLPAQYKTWPAISYKTCETIIQDKQPQIEYFDIYPSIVRRNGKLKLSALCSQTEKVEIWGEQGQILYSSSHFDIVNESCHFTLTQERAPVIAQNEITYYLKASLNNMYASENSAKTIKIMSNGNWQPMVLLEKNIPDGYTGLKSYGSAIVKTVALIQNSYKNSIWAIAQNISNPKSYQLWYSKDGLDWHPYESKGQRIEIPEQYIYSPAVFFKDALHFVGGSMIDPSFSSKDIYKIDLETGSGTLVRNSTNMEMRSQHACVVFPDARGKDNIWIIGGTAKNGAGLNSVWRYDGASWKQEPTPENFPARALFGATVQLDQQGKGLAIWIAGGMSMPDENCLNDIWRYGDDGNGQMTWSTVDNTQQNPIHFVPEENNYATAVTYLETLSNEPYISLVYNHQHENSSSNRYDVMQIRLEKGNEGDDAPSYSLDELPRGGEGLADRPDNERPFVLQSIGFNGCIWLLSVYESPDNAQATNLYFSCPY